MKDAKKSPKFAEHFAELTNQKRRKVLQRKGFKIFRIDRVGIISYCPDVFQIAGSFRAACYFFYYLHYRDIGKIPIGKKRRENRSEKQ